MNAAQALRLLAGRIEAGQIPPPSPSWPLTFHGRDEDHARAIAASLGITGRDMQRAEEEDGLFWYRLRAEVGGVPVEITAPDEPVLLDPPGEPYAAWSLAGGLAVGR